MSFVSFVVNAIPRPPSSSTTMCMAIVREALSAKHSALITYSLHIRWVVMAVRAGNVIEDGGEEGFVLKVVCINAGDGVTDR